MEEIHNISVSQLLMDVENPRLEDIQQSQLEAIRAMLQKQKSKIINLAKDILENGLNPSESMIITPAPGGTERYYVLEGNRRLCALKILENPELSAGIISSVALNRVKNISTQYLLQPIEFVPCVIVNKRIDARHWIELRHEGQQAGAGIVKWGAAEAARFRQRYGQKEIHLQVLDYLEDQGVLKTDDRRQVPITSLKRIVEDRHSRDSLGYDIQQGVFFPPKDPKLMTIIFRQVVSDLSTGKIRVKDIYHKKDRVEYIDRLINQQKKGDDSSSDAATSTKSNKSTSTTNTKKKRKRRVSSDKNRLILIPSRTILVIHQPRINEIYNELRDLKISEFPNAVAVLFRVFVELSVDDYVYKNSSDFSKTPDDVNYKLSEKLSNVAEHLKNNNKINGQQLRSVRHVAAKDQFFAGSITTMHQYIHNPYFKPSIDDLRIAWDNLESFLVAIWS